MYGLVKDDIQTLVAMGSLASIASSIGSESLCVAIKQLRRWTGSAMSCSWDVVILQLLLPHGDHPSSGAIDPFPRRRDAAKEEDLADFALGQNTLVDCFPCFQCDSSVINCLLRSIDDCLFPSSVVHGLCFYESVYRRNAATHRRAGCYSL